MDVNEFSIACKLITMKLKGFEVPKMLPPSLSMAIGQQANSMSIMAQQTMMNRMTGGAPVFFFLKTTT
jgi:hypothetical protein